MKITEQKWTIYTFQPEPRDLAAVFIKNGRIMRNQIVIGWGAVEYYRFEDGDEKLSTSWELCLMGDDMKLLPVSQFEHETGQKLHDVGLIDPTASQDDEGDEHDG